MCMQPNKWNTKLYSIYSIIIAYWNLVLQVGRCNLCGCNNGRLTCTDIEECEDEGEEDDEEERRCERCQDAPQRLVCGRDGRTYRSRCFAINCSRLTADDILEGPCSSQVNSLPPPPLSPSLSLSPPLFLSRHLILIRIHLFICTACMQSPPMPTWVHLCPSWRTFLPEEWRLHSRWEKDMWYVVENFVSFC